MNETTESVTSQNRSVQPVLLTDVGSNSHSIMKIIGYCRQPTVLRKGFHLSAAIRFHVSQFVSFVQQRNNRFNHFIGVTRNLRCWSHESVKTTVITPITKVVGKRHGYMLAPVRPIDTSTRRGIYEVIQISIIHSFMI